MDIRLKRAYDPPGADDGYRVLVDRVWPRGVSKDDLALDEWAKQLAPSSELRRWFGHDPGRWDEFRRRYAAELEGSDPEARDVLDRLRARAREGTVTLVYSARDTEHNNAVALGEHLRGMR